VRSLAITGDMYKISVVYPAAGTIVIVAVVKTV
jgi:hypothetical protein